MLWGKGIKQITLKLLVNAYVYGIWRYINERIFSGTVANMDKDVADVFYQVAVKLQSKKFKMNNLVEQVAMEAIRGMEIEA